MKTLKKLLPHLEIILAGMILVLCVIDRFNSAMAFIDNDITKTLLMILCILSIIVACMLISAQRARERRVAASACEREERRFTSAR